MFNKIIPHFNRLSDVKDKVVAGYELEYLLLEGQCHDRDASMPPPRGLQFTLGRRADEVITEKLWINLLGLLVIIKCYLD